MTPPLPARNLSSSRKIYIVHVSCGYSYLADVDDDVTVDGVIIVILYVYIYIYIYKELQGTNGTMPIHLAFIGRSKAHGVAR